MIAGHGRELVDQRLGDLQPLTYMGLFTDAGLQLGIECRRFAFELHHGILRQGRLAIRDLGDSGSLLLAGILGLPCRSSTLPSKG